MGGLDQPNLLASFRLPFGPPNKCDVALDIIWKFSVSFKIKAFRWRLFVDHLPLKNVLST